MNSPIRAAMAAIAAMVLAGTVSACAATVALDPAKDAANPACAPVSVRLPDEIGDQALRRTNAQATGAWGDPVTVILHCGVPVPPPTAELPCQTVNGIDWLVDGSNAPTFVLTTFGRDPAISVVVDNTAISGRTVLESLAPSVSHLPKNGRACISVEDAGLPSR